MTLIVGVGIGLYLAYAPLGSLMYDRLLAASGTPGTTVFLIFLSDATGYLGTTALLLLKNFDPRVRLFIESTFLSF